MQASDWQYLAEGNANILFKYQGLSVSLKNRVLRLRKQRDLAGFLAAQHHEYLLEVVLPVLGPLEHQVLVGDLVHVDKAFIQALNSKLLSIEPERGAKFRGSRLDTDESRALCMPLLETSEAHLVLEFKPKWLVQSFSAPENAVTCRTCAIRNLRCSGERQANDSRFCPLDFASEHRARVSRAIVGLNKEQTWNLKSDVLDSITDFFCRESIISHLKHAQMQARNSLPLLMTLRDCSIFLEVDMFLPRVTRAYITDLDRKSLGKAHIWHAIEQKLISQGWYNRRGFSKDDFSCIDL